MREDEQRLDVSNSDLGANHCCVMYGSVNVGEFDMRLQRMTGESKGEVFDVRCPVRKERCCIVDVRSSSSRKLPSGVPAYCTTLSPDTVR